MSREPHPASPPRVHRRVLSAFHDTATALRHRPIIAATASFALGILMGDWLWSAGILLTAALLCIGGAVALSSAFVDRAAPFVHLYRLPASTDILIRAAFVAAFAAAGALRMYVQSSPGPKDISRWIGPEFVTVTGRLVSEPNVRRDALFVMSAQSVRRSDGRSEPCSGLLQCSIVPAAHRTTPQYGDFVSITGRIEHPRRPSAPGSAPTDAHLRRHGIFAAMTARYPSLWRTRASWFGLSAPHLEFTRRALALRSSMMREFERRMARRDAALATGVVLGGKHGMAPADADAFMRSGLIHIVAASGANVAILLGTVMLVAHRLLLPRLWTSLLCSAVVVMYAVAAGSEPAVVRAAVMAIAYMAAPLFDRDADAPCSLAAAALGSLAWAPGNLWDPGFQLSFVIVAALSAFGPIWLAATAALRPPARPQMKSRIAALSRHLIIGTLTVFGVSGVAGLAAAPLTAQTFNAVPTLGIVSNALAVPVVAALLPTALIAWLACLIVPPIGDLMVQHLVAPMVHYVGSVAVWVSAIPGTVLHTSSPGWPAVCFAYFVLALLASIIAYGQRT